MMNNETPEQFKIRTYAYKLKHPEVTWQDVADIINSALNTSYTESKYRKEYYKSYKDIVDIDYSCETLDNCFCECSNQCSNLNYDLEDRLAKLRKERTILADIRRDANAQLRSFDRLEYIADIAKECAERIANNIDDYKLNPIVRIGKINPRVGTLILSDWHYGLEIDSYFNSYNPDTCKNRLKKVLERTIEVGLENDIEYLNVVNLGDLISGRIHSQLRIQSRIDAVQQTMEVAELLHGFILELRKYFKIEYYDCLDNHSRIEPNKKESLQLESFTKFIHWHLYWLFKDVNDLNIHENMFGDDIVAFDIFGKTVVGVHGDKDNPSTIVKNMSSLLGRRPDMVLTAHRHHFSGDETTRCPVLCNPSLMGQDQYALDGRLDSYPAQLLVISTTDNPMFSVYRLLAE